MYPYTYANKKIQSYASAYTQKHIQLHLHGVCVVSITLMYKGPEGCVKQDSLLDQCRRFKPTSLLFVILNLQILKGTVLPSSFFFFSEVLWLPVGWTNNYKYWLALRQRALKHHLGGGKNVPQVLIHCLKAKSQQKTHNRKELFLPKDNFISHSHPQRQSLLVAITCSSGVPSCARHAVRGTAQNVLTLSVFCSPILFSFCS